MIRHFQILFALIFSCIVVFGYAQETSKELEAKRKKLEKEIEYTNQLIKQTRKSKQVTLNELKLIGSRISQRNELIATLKKEIVVLDTRIESAEIGIKRLNNELKEF